MFHPFPGFTGVKVFADYELDEIREFIDWQPFFIAWEMHGKFPQILTDAVVGKEATKLYNDANALLDKIVREKWLTPRGVIGFWKAKCQPGYRYWSARMKVAIRSMDWKVDSTELEIIQLELS